MKTRHDVKLDDDDLARSLEQVPAWTRAGDRLHRDFEFPDFATAFGWMSACALAAEKLGHHPDWSNSWSKVAVDLTTHSAGGITERDLSLARRMDELATRFGGA
jgi:4a-hydroxytetrahydrobiopterin dehydratase